MSSSPVLPEGRKGGCVIAAVKELTPLYLTVLCFLTHLNTPGAVMLPLLPIYVVKGMTNHRMILITRKLLRSGSVPLPVTSYHINDKRLRDRQTEETLQRTVQEGRRKQQQGTPYHRLNTNKQRIREQR